MKAMVIYGSVYGNTEKVAQAIGRALGAAGEVETVPADSVKPEQLSGLALLVVGSPTQRFRPIAPVTNLLKSIPAGALRGVKVAAFDTRLTQSQIESVGILAFFVRIFGYAAKPIAGRLQKKGGRLAVPPEGFYVADSEGPLVEGELERAAEWADKIAAAMGNAG